VTTDGVGDDGGEATQQGGGRGVKKRTQQFPRVKSEKEREKREEEEKYRTNERGELGNVRKRFSDWGPRIRERGSERDGATFMANRRDGAACGGASRCDHAGS
jgi:hypothetical protein